VLNHPLILKPSYWLTAILLFIYLGAIAVVISLSSDWFVILPLSMLVIIDLINNLRRYALQISPKSIVQVIPKQEEWLLLDKQGKVWQGKLTENSFRSLYLIILNFKLINTKGKKTVIIFPDSLDQKNFRQLCAQLQIKRSHREFNQ